MPEEKKNDQYSLAEILQEVSDWAPPLMEEEAAPLPSGIAAAPAPDEAEPAQITPPSENESKPAPLAAQPPEPEEAPQDLEAPPVRSEEEEEEALWAAIPPAAKPPEPGPSSDGESPSEETPAPVAEAADPAPDNLIPLFPQQEPETVREVLQITGRRLKLWLRLGLNRVSLPKRREKDKAPRSGMQMPRLSPLPPPPDTPPKELSYQLNKGLGALRLQAFGALLLSILLLGLAVFSSTASLPLPQSWRQNGTAAYVSLVIFPLVLALCYPVLHQGIKALVRAIPGMESLAALAALFTLIDAGTVLFLGLRPMSMPLYAPCAFVLSFQLLGVYWKRRGQRLSCRTAAMAASPDLMTAEPSQWNGKSVYRRRPGDTTGLGSLIQQEDGAQQSFRLFAPCAFVLALLLTLVATVLRQQPQLFFWSLSAGLIAGATLSGCLCFSLPFRGLSRRLSKLGAALAGWPGAERAERGAGLLVEDSDLFPPGSVEITSFRMFNGLEPEQVLSATASLIRASGSGLDSLFYNLLRVEGGNYVTVTELHVENDGISAKAMGDRVLVGNLAFLEREGVAIPAGVRVKTGAFCAISGTFAGQFVLEYSMHKGSGPAMDALLENGITPVLIALDFNLVPSVLRRQFRFPWDKMAFPELGQRAKLAAAPFGREGRLMAVLCLEGLAPLATAAVGAQRLQIAVRLCTRLTCLGAVLGMLLVFYLSVAGSLTALSSVSMTLFLLLWLLPTALISGWVNQF